MEGVKPAEKLPAGGKNNLLLMSGLVFADSMRVVARSPAIFHRIDEGCTVFALLLDFRLPPSSSTNGASVTTATDASANSPPMNNFSCWLPHH
jgi:hypothetical protein